MGGLASDKMTHRNRHIALSPAPPQPQAISLDGLGMHFRLSERAYLASLSWLERHEITALVFGLVIATLKTGEAIIVKRQRHEYEGARESTRHTLDTSSAKPHRPPDHPKGNSK